jgi:hypothetical protein
MSYSLQLFNKTSEPVLSKDMEITAMVCRSCNSSAIQNNLLTSNFLTTNYELTPMLYFNNRMISNPYNSTFAVGHDRSDGKTYRALTGVTALTQCYQSQAV